MGIFGRKAAAQQATDMRGARAALHGRERALLDGGEAAGMDPDAARRTLDDLAHDSAYFDGRLSKRGGRR